MKTKPLWKNGVLVYIGDTEHFKKVANGGKETILYIPENLVSIAISECITGVVIHKGSEAFKDSDIPVEVGTKLKYGGYFGNIFSEKAPTEKNPDNKAYYRIMEDKDFNGFVELDQELELTQ